MKINRSGMVSLLSVLVSLLLVVGGFFASLAEGGYSSHSTGRTPTLQAATGLSFPTLPLSTPTVWKPTLTPSPTTTETITASPSETTTQTPSSTLFLAFPIIQVASVKSPTPTATSLPTLTATVQPTYCGSPRGWVLYLVQPGDTLYSLSLSLNVPMQSLVLANCIQNPSILQAGSYIFVP